MRALRFTRSRSCCPIAGDGVPERQGGVNDYPPPCRAQMERPEAARMKFNMKPLDPQLEAIEKTGAIPVVPEQIPTINTPVKNMIQRTFKLDPCLPRHAQRVPNETLQDNYLIF